jgi:hypothetical protein
MKWSPACLAAKSRAAQAVSLVIPLLLAFVALPQARAATFCVTAGDVAGLQSALAVASNNNEDDLIELQAGQYSMSSNFLLQYDSPTEYHDLTIEGGYGDNFGNPCGTPPAVADASATILDGGLFRVHFAGGVGSFSLESVTVQGTFGTDPIYAPVQIGGYPNWTGNVTIRNSMFLGNASTTTSAVYIFAAEGALSVQNSVFAGNVSLSGANPVHIGSLQVGGAICTLLANSTFTANSSSIAGVDVATPACLAVVQNDIFWGDPHGNVQFDYPQFSYLLNDDLGDLSEATGTQASNLLSVDPLFNPDFSLQDLSPLRDKGVSNGFVSGPYDVIGNPRVYGANPDIGAFEVQDVIFADGFELD